MYHISPKSGPVRIGLGALLLLSASFTTSAYAGDTSVYEPSLLPANPQAGECYARFHIPAQYSTSSESVVVQQGYSSIEVDQPQLKTRSEQVEVKEASVRYEVRQPTYRTVSEQMMVRPAYDKLAVTPAQFRNVVETITTSAPRRVWKLGNPGKLMAQGYKVVSTASGGPRGGQSGRGYTSTAQYGASRNTATHCGLGCEIWCLVEEPGDGVSYNRRVMTTPAHVRRVPVPAKYSTIRKQVVADPGGVREIPVPAEYRTMNIERLVDPGGERYVTNPDVYGDVQKKTLTMSSRYEWRRVVCDPAKGRHSSYSGTSSYNNGTSGYSSGTYSSGSLGRSSHSGYSGTSTRYGSSHGSTSGTISSGHSSTGYTSGGYSSGTRTGYYGTGSGTSSSTYASRSQPRIYSGASPYSSATRPITGGTRSYSNGTVVSPSTNYTGTSHTGTTTVQRTVQQTHQRAATDTAKGSVYYYGTNRPVE